MTSEVRINNDITYDLCKWDYMSFSMEPLLFLRTDDLKQVKEDFKDIENIEIYNNDELVAEFNLYDTYSEIFYIENEFIVDEQTYVNCLKVRLKKSDLVTQVQRLDKQINPVIDTDSMGVDEYRDYILKQVADKCQEDIYAGEIILLNDGTSALFTFNQEDQINLKTLYDLMYANPSIEYLPYHSSGNPCKLYTRKDIQTIYTTLILKLTTKTTYCNAINMYAKSLTTKDEICKIVYGMELPEEYALEMNEILTQTMMNIQPLLQSSGSNSEDTGSTEDNNSTETNGNNTNNTEGNTEFENQTIENQTEGTDSNNTSIENTEDTTETIEGE